MIDTPIPAGWGWRPGAPFARPVPTVADLPDLELLRLLRPGWQTYALTKTLLDHPEVALTVTGADLIRRYPTLRRQQCHDALRYVAQGRLPGRAKRRAA